MTQTSRIELARRRLSIARRAIGVAAAAGFVVFALAARASHPGSGAKSASTSSTPSSTASSTADDSASQDTFDYGQASIAPSSGGGSSLQSGGS